MSSTEASENEPGLDCLIWLRTNVTYSPTSDKDEEFNGFCEKFTKRMVVDSFIVKIGSRRSSEEFHIGTRRCMGTTKAEFNHQLTSDGSRPQPFPPPDGIASSPRKAVEKVKHFYFFCSTVTFMYHLRKGGHNLPTNCLPFRDRTYHLVGEGSMSRIWTAFGDGNALANRARRMECSLERMCTVASLIG